MLLAYVTSLAVFGHGRRCGGFGGKVILDALQKMGIIPNDGWQQVNNLRYSWDVDKVNPRIEVILTEVQNDAAD